MQSQS
jgi:hypothetical protein